MATQEWEYRQPPPWERKLRELAEAAAATSGDDGVAAGVLRMNARSQSLPIEPAAARALIAEARKASTNGNGNVPQQRFRLIPDHDMENLPKPAPLIGDKLTEGGLSALVGPPGCGKTFLALAWECCVAAGVPFGDDDVDLPRFRGRFLIWVAPPRGRRLAVC
ncbi:MAG TPA: AAA family ATPase [Longimicrobiales bacterium]|nr:AAA family ATPase [Longimicrobiales bacterium]